MREPYRELYLLAALILPWLFIIVTLNYSANDIEYLFGAVFSVIIGGLFWLLHDIQVVLEEVRDVREEIKRIRKEIKE